MKSGDRVLLMLNVAMFATQAFLLWFVYTPSINPGGWEYKDVVSILLTAVTIVLAILAIGLGVGAFWGYQQLRIDAGTRAETAAKLAIEQHIKSPAFTASLIPHISEQIRNALQDDMQSRLDVTTERPPSESGREADVPWSDEDR